MSAGDSALQAAVDELLEVCRKHNVILVGTCLDEGNYGEITIGSPDQVASKWDDLSRLAFNRILDDAKGNIYLDAIGDPTP